MTAVLMVVVSMAVLQLLIRWIIMVI